MAAASVIRESVSGLPMVVMKSPRESGLPVIKREVLESDTVDDTDTTEAIADMRNTQKVRMVTVQVPQSHVVLRSRTNRPEFFVDKARAVFPGLYLGATFESYQELTNLVGRFQIAKGVHLYIRSSRKLYPALNHMREVVRDFNQRLMFADIYYACTKGGRRFIKRANGDGELRNCPFNIKVRLTKDGRRLYIRDICPAHNHVLDRNVIPRPISANTPALLKEAGHWPRSKIMKPPSIISRPPIIQTLVRGDVIKDSNGVPRQVFLVPANNRVAVSLPRKVVSVSLPPERPGCGPTVTGLRVPLTRKPITVTAICSSGEKLVRPTDDSVAPDIALKEELPDEVPCAEDVAPPLSAEDAVPPLSAEDAALPPPSSAAEDGAVPPCAEGASPSSSAAEDAALPCADLPMPDDMVKLEPAEGDVQQDLLIDTAGGGGGGGDDDDDDCGALESNEKIVPDDDDDCLSEQEEEHVPDDCALESSAEKHGDDVTGAPLKGVASTKRPQIDIDLPCSDDRFVLSRQHVLEMVRFCSKCGTRIYGRYYSDRSDHLGVTLVCGQGHAVDWTLQKIIRKKITCQLRLPSSAVAGPSVTAICSTQTKDDV